MSRINHYRQGFTIVELLIVIVVIAILAVIGIVAYSGVQQRANNAAIIDAASKSLRAMQAYITVNGTYPVLANGNMCVTSESGCGDGNDSIGANATFDTKMASIATLPRQVPVVNSSEYGIWFTYFSTQTLDGASRPLRLSYYLSGTNQNCGVSDIVQYTWPDFAPSTTGYTSGSTSQGSTRCWVSVPGPGV